MLKISKEVIEREDEVYRIVYGQQERVKRLLEEVEGKSIGEKMKSVRLEMLRQKIVYVLVWEEIESIRFYSEKIRRDLSDKEVKENKKKAIEDLEDNLEGTDFMFNEYYVKRPVLLKDKVRKVNEEDIFKDIIIRRDKDV